MESLQNRKQNTHTKFQHEFFDAPAENSFCLHLPAHWESGGKKHT